MCLGTFLCRGQTVPTLPPEGCLPFGWSPQKVDAGFPVIKLFTEPPGSFCLRGLEA